MALRGSAVRIRLAPWVSQQNGFGAFGDIKQSAKSLFAFLPTMLDVGLLIFERLFGLQEVKP
jgi:hypothetical protein